MEILPISAGMTAVMRKNHPCGGNRFRITRTGADIKSVCMTCGRELTLPRVKFEKSVLRLEKADADT